MKIQQVRLNRLLVPLKQPFRTNLREVTSSCELIVELVTDSGVVGFGSATATPSITGETFASLEAAICEWYAPAVLGIEVTEWSDACSRLSRLMVGNRSALSAFDVALHDVAAKSMGVSLSNMLGVKHPELKTCHTVSLDTVPAMIKQSLELVEQGFVSLKIKLGGAEGAERDAKRVMEIYKAVGDSVSLKLDANQAWNAKQTLHLINQILDKGIAIDFVEQPVPANDLVGLMTVTKNSPVPIAADESAHDISSLLRVLQHQAADIVSLKLLKFGGISGTRRAAHLCEAYGIPCLMSCMLESSVGMAPAAILASSLDNISYVDLDAGYMLKFNPIKNAPISKAPYVPHPLPGHGTGIGSVLEMECLRSLGAS